MKIPSLCHTKSTLTTPMFNVIAGTKHTNSLQKPIFTKKVTLLFIPKYLEHRNKPVRNFKCTPVANLWLILSNAIPSGSVVSSVRLSVSIIKDEQKNYSEFCWRLMAGTQEKFFNKVCSLEQESFFQKYEG